MPGKLALIGYRGLRHEKFFELLTSNDAKILLDVRRNPYSPNPDYQKAAIQEVAPKFGVRYFHVPILGIPGAGKSPIPAGAPTTFEEQIATPESQAALAKIYKLLDADRSVALMCSEPNYLDCHRRHLVDIITAQDPSVEILKLTAASEQRLF